MPRSKAQISLKKQTKADYDGAWKEALDRYLREVLMLCFPAIAKEIDWETPLEFLDKELEAVVRDADLGKQRVDKLVKVRLRDGKTQWILLHVEIASQAYVDLGRTMYQYHHRLTDRFGQPVLSVAVLADDQRKWRPSFYKEDLLGCRLHFKFPICKLSDLGRRWAALEGCNNPAAIVIMAHLRALQTQADMPRRAQHAWDLMRLAHERGFERKDVLELVRLIDWLMTLPSDLKLALREQVLDYEEQNAMVHLSSFEIFSRQEGLEEGRQEARKNMAALVCRLLQKRLGILATEFAEKIEALPSKRLESLGEALLDFQSEKDLGDWLQKSKRTRKRKTTTG